MKRFIFAAIIVTLFSILSTAPAAAIELCNKAWVNIDSTGTADPITLGSAVSGNQTLTDCGILDGQTVAYSIFDGASWEIGTGVYTLSSTTLTRNVVESSNSDTEINLSATATLVVAPLADDFVRYLSPLHSLSGGL